MASEEYRFIPLKGEKKISAILSIPDKFMPKRTPAVILAHGAGNGMFHPLLSHAANLLAEANLLCMRFNFPFRDEDRNLPDPEGVLEAAWVKAYEFLKGHPEYRPSWIVAAGKSLGGRIASQAVAENHMQVRGLVFLGYPLHSSGRTETLRDAHLYRIRVPMLFFAGTRDPLCNLDRLGKVLARMDAVSTLEVIEGADHSFKLPESSGVTEQEVYARILGKTLSWLKTV